MSAIHRFSEDAATVRRTLARLSVVDIFGRSVIRTFSYPLRPTRAQEATLTAWIAQCCDLYNAALQERRDAWKKQRVSVTMYDQCKGLTEWRRSDADGKAVPPRRSGV